MHRTMAHYGMRTDDLVTHWERYHAQGVTCPDCFMAAWARSSAPKKKDVADKKSLDGPFPHATI